MFESIAAMELPALAALVAAVDVDETGSAQIDQLEALERLKSAAAAAQARITDSFDQRQQEFSPNASDRGTGAQIGLARRDSPHAGRAHLRLARALVHDLPQTYAALARGDLSERRASIIATETQDLSRADRLRADAMITADTDRLVGLGDLKLQWAVRRIVLRIDEAAVVRRRARAGKERRVTARLLPDGMAQVTGIVPDTAYAAIMTSLRERAAQRKAMGDERSRGQIVADEFVARLTNQVTAVATPVEVQLVMSAETLLGHDDTPADLAGVGPIPASVGRAMLLADEEVKLSIRRLFAFPDTDRLVAMESTRRAFDGKLRQFVEIRDRLCRTPWCNAPIAHRDHVKPVRAGGATSADNGQGLCETCNHVKEEIGWRHRNVARRLHQPFDEHLVEITTPTGHCHRSRPPGLPTPLPERARSRVEMYAAKLILVA